MYISGVLEEAWLLLRRVIDFLWH